MMLIGCGRKTPPVPTATTIAPAAISPTAVTIAVASPTPIAIATPGIGDILWSTETDSTSDAPLVVASEYPSHAPRLTASALALNLPPGTIVDTAWSYNNTPLEAFTTQIVLQDDVPKRWISFRLERDPDVPWPSGTYAVAISIDGTPTASAAVQVND